MKKITLLLLTVVYSLVNSQDLPPITQKLSDGVWQFPSLTGYSGGAAYVAHRRAANSNLQFAPTISMSGIHGSFLKNKLGIGGNVYYETVNVLRSVVASAQVSNHIKLNTKYDISFGLSTELYRSDIDQNKLEAVDLTDSYLINFKPITLVDFSPGINVSHKRYQLGLTANRLRKIIAKSPEYLLNGYYTAFYHGYYNFVGVKHKLEPSLICRYNPLKKEFKNEAWLFYTNSEKYTLGFTYILTGRFGTSVAYRSNNRWVFGYSFDSQISSKNTGVYSKYNHEIVIRFNLNKQYYRKSDFNPDNQPRKNISREKSD